MSRTCKLLFSSVKYHTKKGMINLMHLDTHFQNYILKVLKTVRCVQA